MFREQNKMKALNTAESGALLKIEGEGIRTKP